METALLVWSAAGGSQGKPGGGLHLPHHHADRLLPPAGGGDVKPSGEELPPPPPRPSKAKKKPAGPKKPPQRGLGVEQLEHLRLREEWKKVATGVDHSDQLLRDGGSYRDHKGVKTPTLQVHGRSIQQTGSGGVSLAMFAAGLQEPAVWGGAWGESYSFLQRYGLLGGAVGGYLVGNPVAFPAMNRYRVAMAEATLQVGNGAFTEFPSSQSLQCSGHCDICVRKKRMLEKKFGMAEGNGEPGEGWRRTAASAEVMVKEVKEYVFFPCRSSGGGGNSSRVGSALEGRTSVADAPSSSTSYACNSKQLDLSLKLSF